MDNELIPHYINQLLYLESKIPDTMLKNIENITQKMIDDENNLTKTNKILAGNIEKEYKLQNADKILCPFLYDLCNKFYDFYPPEKRKTETKNKKWMLTGCWVNYQKKYEFNPIHNHNGILSFVIWIKIPYNLEKELKLPNCKNSNSQSNSLFEFVYLDIFGEIVTSKVPLNKFNSGTIAIFSSDLRHMVNPFYTSDQYRISIAGNLVLVDNFTDKQLNLDFN